VEIGGCRALQINAFRERKLSSNIAAMNSPKKHHYVPQFYLKHFSNAKEMIWVYDRKENTYRHQNVKDTAVQKHFYRFRSMDGGHNTELEELLSNIEGNAATAITNIAAGRTPTSEDIEWLAMFVSFQATRVPDFQKRNQEMKEKMMKRLQKMRFHSESEHNHNPCIFCVRNLLGAQLRGGPMNFHGQSKELQPLN
jgi:hypothetical protein